MPSSRRPATPWAAFRTEQPLPFDCLPSANGLVVSGGPSHRKHPSISLLPDRDIRMVLPGETGLKLQAAAKLQLARRPEWQGRRFRVNLHPFAIVHLLVTAQVPQRGLLAMAAQSGRGVTRLELVVRGTCELTSMLRADLLQLVFATDHDLAIEPLR